MRIVFEQLLCFDTGNDNSLNNNNPESSKTPIADTWQIFIDGAARNNPGPAGAGVYMLKNNILFYEDGYYLGARTNNQAEYIALLVGLFFAEEWKKSSDTLIVYSDSQLLVRQLQGIYKVKNSQLQLLHQLANIWLKKNHSTINHITRDYNTKADAMANKGIESRKSLPSKFIAQVRAYNDEIL
jgi:ribonuclease HI